MEEFFMEFSPETTAVLEYLDAFTQNNLRKRNDIGSILEAASKLGAAAEFNNLVFVGKVSWNLYSAIRRITPNDEGYQTLEREFATNMNQLRAELLFFVTNTPDEQQQRFEQIYLGLGQGTMRNLVDLAHDLARFKDLQAEQKR